MLSFKILYVLAMYWFMKMHFPTILQDDNARVSDACIRQADPTFEN